MATASKMASGEFKGENVQTNSQLTGTFIILLSTPGIIRNLPVGIEKIDYLPSIDWDSSSFKCPDKLSLFMRGKSISEAVKLQMNICVKQLSIFKPWKG
jgi:hypothetical protein